MTTHPRLSMAPIVLALGLTQIIGYGTLYYSFGTLAPSIAAEFAWPQEWVYGALTVSLLVGGLIAPISGRLSDRYGAARMMCIGSIAAALALAAAAMAPERYSFAVALIACEAASSFVFYATAFTLLVQAAASGAQRSITHLTLIGGFASTVFWPVTSALHEQLGWREIYLIYAGLNLLVAAPVHFWLAGHVRRQRAGAPSTAPGPLAAPLVAPERQAKVIALLMLGFALLSFVASAILVHMVPLLATLGLAGVGAMVAALFGPAQVASRLINMQFGKGLSQTMLGVISAGLLPLALVVLALTAPWAPGAALFAVLFGLGNGLSSIVAGTLPLVLFGASGYGRRQGTLSSARLVVSALAPVVFSIMLGAGGAGGALWLVALVGVGATAAFTVIWLTVDEKRVQASALSHTDM
jgi:MFS family permease